MSLPKTTQWKCEAHTQAKHRLLERYLQAWFPILNKYNGKIVYLDGFSGPGKYSDGEKGSPFIALEVAKNHSATLNGELKFVFVEENKKRFKSLEQNIAGETWPSNFGIICANTQFHLILTELLDDLDKRNLSIAPLFAFIDPFGFSGLPFSLLKRLLTRDHTEIFIYFARNSINRFLNAPNPKVASHMEALFGEKIIIPEGLNRLEFLKNVYEDKLKLIAKYVGFFTMETTRGRPNYDLFFASNNSKGYEKMKEAMWAVDPSGNFRFTYKEDANSQLNLFRKEPIEALADNIYTIGKLRKGIEISRIEKYVIEKTIYITKHTKAALKFLENERRIMVLDYKTDGKKRKKGTYPDNAIIDFIEASI